MLEIFRRYQKILFLVITVMVIFSFIFFGTYSTFVGSEERPDRLVGKLIDGSKMMLSEVQRLSRFIATDREDSLHSRGLSPNFCNDGVIRYDFIKDGLANLIITEYFDVLKGDFESRLDRAKRFKPYQHPEAPFLSAKRVWDHFFPSLNDELVALQKETEVTPKIFPKLEKLYLYQSRLKPEMLRQILIYQHRQLPNLPIDQRLSYDDLALFGFQTTSDWFGHHFVDLVAEFILNAAAAAEEKGYQVTLQEAKGDLIHHFQETMEKAKMKPDMSFQSHLQRLGFDERSASEVWRKVLLFRRYFQDVGGAAFVDKLPYKDFVGFAKEIAVVDVYRWPICVSSAQDLAELQYYMKAIAKEMKDGLPISLLPVDEVEKKVPELVQKTVKAKVAEASKKQIASRASVKQVWDWEIENWEILCKEFSLPKRESREEKFLVLEASSKRDEIDAFSREKIVEENPAWVEEALAAAPLNERSWEVQGRGEPALKNEGSYFRIEDLEIVKDKHILTFHEAKEILSKLVAKVEGEFDKEKSPFVNASQLALASLKKDPNNAGWLQSGNDQLFDQFRLEKKRQGIERTAREDWMKEQAFMILPELWSSIHVADHGEVLFFYLQERKAAAAPILDQLSVGKEILAADAKLYATERLLEVVKRKNAIVVPVQKEDE